MKNLSTKIAAVGAVLAGTAVVIIEIVRFRSSVGGWFWIIVGLLAVAFGGYELAFGREEPKKGPPAK